MRPSVPPSSGDGTEQRPVLILAKIVPVTHVRLEADQPDYVTVIDR